MYIDEPQSGLGDYMYIHVGGGGLDIGVGEDGCPHIVILYAW